MDLRDYERVIFELPDEILVDGAILTVGDVHSQVEAVAIMVGRVGRSPHAASVPRRRELRGRQ